MAGTCQEYSFFNFASCEPLNTLGIASKCSLTSMLPVYVISSVSNVVEMAVLSGALQTDGL